MFQRRRPELVRDSHPDAAVEVRLQRIVSLQLAVARKEARLAENAEAVRKLRSMMRADSASGFNKDRKDQVSILLKEIAELEAEVAGLHDEIEKRVGELSETDLAYLNPRRRKS